MGSPVAGRAGRQRHRRTVGRSDRVSRPRQPRGLGVREPDHRDAPDARAPGALPDPEQGRRWSGKPITLKPWEANTWKDIVRVPAGSRVRVIMDFEDYPGRFPDHCHILDHEDHEMMRQFQTTHDPANCNNNGTCEFGEDCQSCPNDCAQVSGASCGNGLCEGGDGENCITCPEDCAGKQKGSPPSSSAAASMTARSTARSAAVLTPTTTAVSMPITAWPAVQRRGCRPAAATRSAKVRRPSPVVRSTVIRTLRPARRTRTGGQLLRR